MNELQHHIVQTLRGCSQEERYAIFQYLRGEFPIHELEVRLNASAEVILEAISRASDLTLRGVRGIIAEAYFKQEIVVPFTTRNGSRWQEVPLTGDHSYDFALEDGQSMVKIQVKMQRQKEQRPMRAGEASQRLFGRGPHSNDYVVETQRTRGGTANDGSSTRPYQFGSFDILAVSMHPSTGNWSNFLYTVERWLMSAPDAPNELFKYQAVPHRPDEMWTDDLSTAIQWLRSSAQRLVHW